MKRILISQNETNNNTDYVLEDGNLIKDEGIISDLHYEVTNSYLNAKMIYEKGDLRVKKIENKIIIQSYYNDTDVIGRRIFYMFYIDDFKTLSPEDMIEFLKQDSQVLSRSINEYDETNLKENLKKVLNVIDCLITKISQNKRTLTVALLLIFGLITLNYIYNKIK